MAIDRVFDDFSTLWMPNFVNLTEKRNILHNNQGFFVKMTEFSVKIICKKKRIDLISRNISLYGSIENSLTEIFGCESKFTKISH